LVGSSYNRALPKLRRYELGFELAVRSHSASSDGSSPYECCKSPSRRYLASLYVNGRNKDSRVFIDGQLQCIDRRSFTVPRAPTGAGAEFLCPVHARIAVFLLLFISFPILVGVIASVPAGANHDTSPFPETILPSTTHR